MKEKTVIRIDQLSFEAVLQNMRGLFVRFLRSRLGAMVCTSQCTCHQETRWPARLILEKSISWRAWMQNEPQRIDITRLSDAPLVACTSNRTYKARNGAIA